MKFSETEDDTPLISSQPGWTVVLLALLFSLFWGGAFRLFFGPDKVRGWVTQQINRSIPGTLFQIDQASFSLSDGIWPQFAVQLKGVTLLSEDPCLWSPKVEIDVLEVPLNLASLLKGKVIFSGLKAKEVKIALRAQLQKCEIPRSSASITGSTPTSTNLGTSASPPANASSPPPSSKEISRPGEKRESLKDLPYIKIERVSVDNQINPSLSIDAYNVYAKPLNPSEQLYSLEGAFILSKIFSFEPSITPVSFEGKVKPKFISLDFEGHLREGAFLSHLEIDIKKNEMMAHMSLKHIPMFELIRLANHNGIFKWNMETERLWLSGVMDFKSQVSPTAPVPLNFKDLKVEGTMGVCLLKELIVNTQGEVLRPTVMTLSQVDLNQLSYLIHKAPVGSSLGRLGLLTGELEIKSREEMKLKGFLNNMEVIFSNRGKQTYQLIHQMDVEMMVKNDRFSVQIPRLNLNQGQFEGLISLNSDLKFSEVLFQVAISHLSLAPTVQENLVDGEMTPLEIYGKGRFKKGGFDAFEFEMGMKKMKNDEVDIEGVKLTVTKKEEMTSLGMKIKKIFIFQKGFIWKILRPLFLEKQFKEMEIVVKDTSSLWELDKQGNVRWKKAQGFVGDIALASEGGWDTEESLTGWVSVDFPSAKGLKADITGTRSAPLIASLKGSGNKSSTSNASKKGKNE